ncbi:hypothetical protein B0H11DRAFT_1718567 [Mycena galericulata]|nr:hypothetical protein B0H11DRAFT_1718567 [Mycena galericulata]
MGSSTSKSVDLHDSIVIVCDGASQGSSRACSLVFSSVEEEFYATPTLTEGILRGALNSIAEVLEEQNRYIQIVTVGGAVNTILLRTRLATGDVDFFYHTHKDDAEVENLVRVAESVARSIEELSDEWLNNHTASFIEGSVLKRLYRQSIEQNRLVFDSSSLKVYAAAWPFAFVQKVIRYGSEQQKVYDIDDAVAYLKEMKEGANISYEKVAAWADDYKPPRPKEEAFKAVIAKYRGGLNFDEGIGI